MVGKTFADGQIIQVAYVTPDCEKAVQEFGRQYGVTGWAIIEQVAFGSVTLRGAPCEAKIKAAVGFQGDMMYEFIQPLDELPSVYRDADGGLMVGFHHLARVVDDLGGAIKRYQADGYSVAMDASLTNGGRAVYMERPGSTTGFIELFERSPQVLEFLDGVASLERPMSDGKITITRW